MSKRGNFQGFPGGNMQNIMRQAQIMQQQIKKMSEELESCEYSATAGGGAVSCVINGKRELISLVIKPEIVDSEDVELLQDIIMVAINDALHQVEEARRKESNKMGLGVGGELGGIF